MRRMSEFAELVGKRVLIRKLRDFDRYKLYEVTVLGRFVKLRYGDKCTEWEEVEGIKVECVLG